jgi:hypothetical protein
MRIAVMGHDGVGRGTVTAADRPIVAVLNKADMTGLGDGGPSARAYRRPADYRALTGVPTVPMVALLATADLDDEPTSAHQRRAVHWRRYSRGPVSALHRNCGADIARGSPRLVGRAR